MNDKEIIATAEAHWKSTPSHVRTRLTSVLFKRLLDHAKRLESANVKLRAFVEAFARCPCCEETRACHEECEHGMDENGLLARELLEDIDR